MNTRTVENKNSNDIFKKAVFLVCIGIIFSLLYYLTIDMANVFKYIVAALLGGLSCILVNKGIATFNDALRPIMPEYIEGRMTRAELAATSFALGFGLVIGFGIPFSIGSPIILAHSILLGSDIIGIWCPDSKKGTVLSGVIGSLYGVGLVYGLEIVVNLFAMLPVNFLDALGNVGSPVVAAFSIFPAVVVGYQHGFGKGVITFIVIALVNQITLKYGVIPVGDVTVKLSADGMALLVGVLMMLAFAMSEKSDGSNSNQALVGIFAERLKNIKKNIFVIAVMGGLVAAATSLKFFAGDPTSLELLGAGKSTEASIAAFARAIGFIPLVYTTAITTGVYGPVGTTLVFVVGIVLIGNPIVAFLVASVVMFLEVLLLEKAAAGLDKFPGIKKSGDHVRTAMNKVLEIAIMAGSMMAGNTLAPGTGFLFVAGAYALNKTAKKSLVEIAVGPVAVIILGILLNILFAIGLYTPIA